MSVLYNEVKGKNLTGWSIAVTKAAEVRVRISDMDGISANIVISEVGPGKLRELSKIFSDAAIHFEENLLNRSKS